ncbi:hypothetical protein [Actinoplanes sp. NPDC049118]|uniref:hypothetical protein n=1 Tax=Actinoplanes sp. NPDC049118 TaxID=3155769 RepID=UPI0033C6B18A
MIRRFESGGLPVELEVLPWACSFGAALAVGCGSRDDSAGREGAAHLAEHLMVLSDPAAGPGGAPLLAVTGIDRTVYRGVGDPDDVGILVRRLLDIAGGRCAPAGPDVFEGERHAVLLETSRMDHQPLLRLGPLLAAAAATEPGLDAIAATTTESVRRVTPADVAELIARGYSGTNARLFLAGPPSVIRDVEAALERPDTAGTTTPHRPVAAPDRFSLPGLGDLVAVTLVRPRNVPSPALDALLGDRGPIVGLGTADGRRPLGRTTIEGRAQRVDVAVWRGDAAPFERRFAEVVAGDWQALAEASASPPRGGQTVDGQWRRATPIGRVSDAADRCVFFPAEPSELRQLALWRVTDGRPECLARHRLGTERR